MFSYREDGNAATERNGLRELPTEQEREKRSAGKMEAGAESAR